MYNGKVRGQKRKLKKLFKYIEEIEPYKDLENVNEYKFEHFHVPSSVWIEMPKTSSKIKTLFCKAWIRKTEEILKAKPEGVDIRIGQESKMVCHL